MNVSHCTINIGKILEISKNFRSAFLIQLSTNHKENWPYKFFIQVCEQLVFFQI